MTIFKICAASNLFIFYLFKTFRQGNGNDTFKMKYVKMIEKIFKNVLEICHCAMQNIHDGKFSIFGKL